MNLIRTNDLIAILRKHDPEGSCIVSFYVYDDLEPDDLIAQGEVYEVGADTKHAKQTDEGDRQCIRLHLRLDPTDL